MRQQRKFDNVEVAPATGINNESQIDSVIREMAELQANIFHEKASCDYRISLLKKYTDEVIEPWASHMIALQVMLRDFFKKQKIRKFSREYSFGSLSFSRSGMKLSLNAELAKQRMGKP
jgi:hypothetical protein